MKSKRKNNITGATHKVTAPKVMTRGTSQIVDISHLLKRKFIQEAQQLLALILAPIITNFFPMLSFVITVINGM